MPDKKLTDKEILDLKELLEYKAKVGCQNCDLIGKGCCSTCLNSLIKQFIELFDRLQAEKQNLEIELQAMRGAANSYKAEVERLKDILICFMGALSKVRNIDDIESISVIPLMTELNKGIRAEIKAEAYKEFANELKCRTHEISYNTMQVVNKDDIDNLLKELVGEDDVTKN